MNFKLINLKLVVLLVPFGAFWCFLVFLVLFLLVKSYHEKKKKFKKWPNNLLIYTTHLNSEAATRTCFSEKLFWKYEANLQENNPAEVWFATLLKMHFSIDVLLEICYIFSEQLLLWTPLGGCFCKLVQETRKRR